MKVTSFIQDYAVIDKTINHLKLAFIAERSPPPYTQAQLLMAAEDVKMTLDMAIAKIGVTHVKVHK